MKTRKNAGGYERLRIGSNIRKWRNIKEVKQKDLASALKMSEAAISNMENDLTDLTLSQLEDISVTLDIEIEKLFFDAYRLGDISNDIIFMDDLRIYVDRDFHQGNWSDRPQIGGNGYDFVEEYIGKTHTLNEHLADEGYLLAFPIRYSEEEVMSIIK